MHGRAPRPTAPRGPIAPIHRGPQAASPATVHAGSFHHAPNAALLIDFDNVTMGIRSDLQTELKNLLSSDIIKGKVAVQRAYADWRRYPQYVVPLAESSIDMIMAPAYGSSKKNATDIRLAIDALELVFTRPEIGTFILLSGDSDFSSLVVKLKEYGKYVIGVGIRESSSDLLVMNCDEYYSYNALAGLVRTSDEEIVKRDPWELVTEALARMVKNGDVMRADRLKQVMQDIDASFDEKDLGMSKFSKFVQEAAQRGLLALNRLENGQFEIAPPGGSAAVPAADVAQSLDDAAADGDDESGERGSRERGRRRRGRGRGRDRERGEREPRPIGEVVAQAAAAGAPPAEDEVAPAVVRPADAPRAARGRDLIGLAGERLTRAEAFDLVRRAVEASTTGDLAVSTAVVREKAFALLGRDSESLSERHFVRILQDAHDADMVDLRKRGDGWEVAPVQQVAAVADQLAAAEKKHAPAPVAAPAAQRSIVPRGSGRGGRGGVIPPELLMVGVVDDTPAAPAPAPTPAPVVVAAVAPAVTEPEAPVAKGGRGRPAKGAAKAPAAKKGAAAPAKGGAGKPAAKAPAAKAPVAKAPAARKAAAKAPAAAKKGAAPAKGGKPAKAARR
jgi:uncharacterized LabA/DUF88 family protein